MINLKQRSIQSEIMDDFSIQGEALHASLDTIAAINKYLGGNQLTLNGLKRILLSQSGSRPFKILDIGCGNGDMLRIIARYARKNGLKIQMVGIDANPYTIEYARQRSKDYPEIRYQTQNVFSESFLSDSYDIVLATLFLHHFQEAEIVRLLSRILQKVKIGILVNDLQRSVIAFYLFKIVCLFIPSKMAREDGQTSIRRAFKKRELVQMARQLEPAESSIRWKWAFRYEWIIRKS